MNVISAPGVLPGKEPGIDLTGKCIMRRKDREITDWNTIIQIIESLPIGHLAMVDGGEPYGITMNYSSEIIDGKIVLYFHGAGEGRKNRILQKNSLVYFFAEQYFGATEILYQGNKNYTSHYRSVAGGGRMVEIDDENEKRQYLQKLVRKYFSLPIPFLIPQKKESRPEPQRPVRHPAVTANTSAPPEIRPPTQEIQSSLSFKHPDS